MVSSFVLLRRRSLKRVIAEKSTRITSKWFESINFDRQREERISLSELARSIGEDILKQTLHNSNFVLVTHHLICNSTLSNLYCHEIAKESYLVEQRSAYVSNLPLGRSGSLASLSHLTEPNYVVHLLLFISDAFHL